MSQVVENELQVGDLVRVIAPDSLLHGLEGRIAQTDFGAGEDPYKFESACGEHRGWLSAGQLRKLTASSVEGEPHRDGLVLRSEWNAKEGCFEDSIVDPEKYSEWEPKIDGWVRLPEGKVAKVKCVKIINGSVLYGFHGTNIMYTLGTLRPWTPSVGDSVKVIRENSMNRGLIGTVKRDDGKYSASYFVETKSWMGWFTAKCLEPAEPVADHIADADKMVKSIEDPAKEPETIDCNHHICQLAKPTGIACPPDSCDIDDGVRELPATDHIADANKMVPPAIPAGWRELFDGEALSKTDLYRDGGKWVPYGDFNPAGSTHPKYDKRIHYQHIRKIEQWPGHVQGVWVEEGLNATSINFEPKRPVVYIAGPMRGIPHFNFPAFDAAKAYLIGKGYDVLSPADFDRELDGFDPYKPEYETAEGCADFPKTMDFRRVVTRDLTAVTQCDAVALLPGWENSNGAVAEIAVAHWMGKPLIHLYGVDHTQGKSAFHVIQESATTLKQFALWLADAHVDMIEPAIALTPPEQNPDCDILEVAASITRGDRQAVYGPPDQDFKKTADMWTGMFQYMLADGAKFEPRHVAMAMICIKLSREFHQRKRDNWIDIAGYARCGSLCSS